MLIDLRSVSQETHFQETLGQDWWKVADTGQQVVGLSRPLEARIKVSRVSDKFVVQGTLSGELKIRCDRCLEPFDLAVETSFHLYLVTRGGGESEEEVELLDEEMEVDFIKGETLDLDEVIQEQLYLSVPMKCVCAAACRGLCPQCGANLNVAPCRCGTRTAGVAFSK